MDKIKAATTTSLTFYIDIKLKQRIDAAAAGEDRSTSKYLSRLLDKIVPPAAEPRQLDIEAAIAKQSQEAIAAVKQTARIRKVAQKATRSPARGK